MGCGPSQEETTRPNNAQPRPNDGGLFQGFKIPGLDNITIPGSSNTRKVSDSSRGNQGMPNLQIPQRTNNQLIPDVSVFEKRDKWSTKVPDEHCGSVSDLAGYLAHEAKTDIEKARAFYKWMCLNICYDVESYLTKEHIYPSDPASVLKYRTSVCDGYAQLFEALCKSASVRCYYVAGFSKGTSYNPDIPITEDSFVNHAWNVVCIDGEWWPVDVTWGAGYMDKSNHFVWHYNDLNFLTDPDVFILAHFPYMEDSARYSEPFQLLGSPITLEDFNLAVKPDRNGMEWGLEMRTHSQLTIDVAGEVTIQFRTKKVTMTNMSCNFHDKRTGEDCERHVIMYQNDGVFSAKVQPPGEGLYKLMFFGETAGMDKQQGLVNYIINCTDVDGDVEPYPDHFGIWGGQPEATKCGFGDEIFETNIFTSEDGYLQFSLPLKRRVDTIVRLEHSRKSGSLDEYVSDAANNTTMVILTRLPYKGYYKLQLFANDSGGSSYLPVGFFFIDCRQGMKPCSRFAGTSEAQQFLAQESSKPRKKKSVPKIKSTPPPVASVKTDEDVDVNVKDEDTNQDRVSGTRTHVKNVNVSNPAIQVSSPPERNINEVDWDSDTSQGHQDELITPEHVSQRRGSVSSNVGRKGSTSIGTPTVLRQKSNVHAQKPPESRVQQEGERPLLFDPYTGERLPVETGQKKEEVESEEDANEDAEINNDKDEHAEQEDTGSEQDEEDDKDVDSRKTSVQYASHQNVHRIPSARHSRYDDRNNSEENREKESDDADDDDNNEDDDNDNDDENTDDEDDEQPGPGANQRVSVTSQPPSRYSSQTPHHQDPMAYEGGYLAPYNQATGAHGQTAGFVSPSGSMTDLRNAYGSQQLAAPYPQGVYASPRGSAVDLRNTQTLQSPYQQVGYGSSPHVSMTNLRSPSGMHNPYQSVYRPY